MAAVTIRDVAKHAGVGVATVSRVINESPSVSPPTRQKVLSAIDKLEYVPHTTARRLSLGKTLTIGVVVPFFTNSSVVERLRGVVSVLKDSEYDMILFDVASLATRDSVMMDVTRRERVDGLLIISLVPTDEEARRLAESEVPAVLVDATHPDLHYTAVDNVHGGYLATRHLIELGHLNIAYLSDYLDNPFNSPALDRQAGYQKALREADIPIQPSYQIEGEYGREQARDMTRQLLAQKIPPTAIFAYCDTQALGVIEAAQDQGLHVPEHLSIVGYDDIEAAELMQLTTVRQHLFASGARGASMLLDAIADQPAHPRQVIVEPDLIVRRTTSFPA